MHVEHECVRSLRFETIFSDHQFVAYRLLHIEIERDFNRREIVIGGEARKMQRA